MSRIIVTTRMLQASEAAAYVFCETHGISLPFSEVKDLAKSVLTAGIHGAVEWKDEDGSAETQKAMITHT